MKKFGFTLAEVLITLGIIGVVAALATPALVTSAGNAKVGPSLAKAVSTITTANEMMLAQEEVSSIIPGIISNVNGASHGFDEYWMTIQKYMKMSAAEFTPPDYTQYRGTNAYVAHQKLMDGSEATFGGTNKEGNLRAFLSSDGIAYYVRFMPKERPFENLYADIPSNQLIGDLYIDINGSSRPNRIGKDLFRFLMYNDGSLKPYGSIEYDKRTGPDANVMSYWNKDHGCDEEDVTIPDTCAGSIFENNQKIIYQ